MTSRTVTHCTFCDEELVIHLKIMFISKFTENKADALKLVSTGDHGLVGNDRSHRALRPRENGTGSCPVNIGDRYLCSILRQRSSSYSQIFDCPSRIPLRGFTISMRDFQPILKNTKLNFRFQLAKRLRTLHQSQRIESYIWV